MMVEPDQQDVERDLVRRLLPLGAFDQRDHAVEERRAGRRRDADDDAVRDHGGAAGHRRAVAAGFADHRRGFAGDGRLVDRGDAFDHLAVAGDDVAGLAHDEIAGLQVFGGDAFDRLRDCRASGCAWRASRVRVLRSVSACALPRPSATASARLANSTVNHSQITICSSKPIACPPVTMSRSEQNGGQQRHHFEHEHHRVLGQRARVELDEGLADRRDHDRRIEQRGRRHALAQFSRFPWV